MKRIWFTLALTVATPATAALPTVERAGAVMVKLDWSGWEAKRPVSVYLADSPYAKGGKRRLVVRDERDGSEVIKTEGAARPYFWLKAKGGPSVWLGERQIKLIGGSNFRDIGGYSTTNGKIVRWGQMFRAANIGGYTTEDQARVKALGVSSMIDLRSSRERKGDAHSWMAAANMGYWSRDYELSAGNLGSLAANISKLTPEMMRETMIKGYRGFPKEQAASYREMFARLTGKRGPVMINCTAGKDRTGLATALVLTALGVPYETVMQDFLLSNVMLDAEALKKDGMLKMISTSLPPEVAKPLIAVEPAYLDAGFEQIRTDYGSVESYLEKELGVGPKEIKLLKKRMLK
jgi:protein-tyrosine phosphatase